MQMTGAELFVKALKEEQVTTLFAYPGGQAIDLFNALYGEKDINVILPRHEQGLVHAADGYARSTGKVGVCLVTSGPGATNLVTGIATANYDSLTSKPDNSIFDGSRSTPSPWRIIPCEASKDLSSMMLCIMVDSVMGKSSGRL